MLSILFVSFFYISWFLNRSCSITSILEIKAVDQALETFLYLDIVNKLCKWKGLFPVFPDAAKWDVFVAN